jgi:hypothetical protein
MTLLGIISNLEGDAIEHSSHRWPVSLRRRFISARYYRIRKRWPFTHRMEPLLAVESTAGK